MTMADPIAQPPVKTLITRCFPVEGIDVMRGMGTRWSRVSQGFHAPEHMGVDIMFRRLPGEPVTTSPGNAEWCMPAGVRALAFAAGTVVYAKQAANGWRVRLSHGPLDTLYLHLAAAPLVVQGQRVGMGDPLGVVGADPTDPEKLPHLHFETRLGSLGTMQTPIDPGIFLSSWSLLNDTAPTGEKA